MRMDKRSRTAARGVTSMCQRSCSSRWRGRLRIARARVGARRHPRASLRTLHSASAASARGFIVIAPEYRGSIGYGRATTTPSTTAALEVDDVTTAVSVLRARYGVDPDRIGIVGWSHGGLIALLATFRNPGSSGPWRPSCR